MTSRSVLLVLLLLPLAEANAAPFTAEEIGRRMQAGTQLSAICYLEARVNREVTGDNCRHLTTWIQSEFPLIKRDLARASAGTVTDFETYKKNLAAIIAIADAAAQPLTPAHPSPL